MAIQFGLMKKIMKNSIILGTKAKKKTIYLCLQHNSQRNVTDSGYHMRPVVCDQGVTFREVIWKYLSHVGSPHGECVIAFDGYQDGLSTKDHKHFQWNFKSTVSVDIIVQLDDPICVVTMTKNLLLDCWIKLLLVAVAMAFNFMDMLRLPLSQTF